MKRKAFIDLIASEHEDHVALLERFVQAPSPNPPGDTLDAANVLKTYLERQGVAVRVLAPQGDAKPNLVAEFSCGDGDDGDDDERARRIDDNGRRVMMNGHIDVFPVDESRGAEWKHDRGPWSGYNDGKYIWGRGGVDMKAGTAASAIAFGYLYRHRQHLKLSRSSVALSLVSDEETGGTFGSRWLLEQDPDRERWKGDVMINAEPGGLRSIRFGEKGTLRMTFTVTTKGLHGAYTHISEGANRVASRLVNRLVKIEDDVTPDLDESIVEHMRRPEVRSVVDDIMGKGASENILRPTVNVGVMNGGIKVNMIPDRCLVEVDIRLPIGLTKEVVLSYIDRVLDDREFKDEEKGVNVEYAVQEAASNPSSYGAVSHEMVGMLARAAEDVTGKIPLAIPSLGATDAKFWRYHGVPAFVYGVGPDTMAAAVDERVSIDEFLSVIKVHAVAVWDYLGGGQ
ncbi:hypothetical protein PV08_04525 [Exophiala spinifera]|uniref:Peptidase M20 dimerisation domain-containing protein n=1 Tax=Exophiala spinifera TaxID=91928 RepID=A0A0D2BEB4_9EURO|nr:uncharacterized protein PV08_04525 [Exophiala spinifera]KIW17333.1 hypothetical protein PV08_04525 [Exophiala spinifera]